MPQGSEAQGRDARDFIIPPDYSLKRGELKVTGHMQNFIDCVRSRKQDQLNADILEGHLSSVMCHLANVSVRLGRDVPFSEKPCGLGENEHVVASVKSIEDELQGALGMDLKKYTYTLGAKLQFCPKAEKFLGNPDADKLLTRPYRSPFCVPEKV